MRLRPARSWRAESLRTYPSRLIADSTRILVGPATVSGRLRTFDTVPTETPAARATSLMPGGCAMAKTLPSSFGRRVSDPASTAPRPPVHESL